MTPGRWRKAISESRWLGGAIVKRVLRDRIGLLFGDLLRLPNGRLCYERRPDPLFPGLFDKTAYSNQ